MSDEAIKIFYSYSRKDQTLREKLDQHLAPLRHAGLISTWYDLLLDPGSKWKQDIEGHLDTSDIILLLVSDNFFSSEFCYSIELKRALEREARKEACVIPIILKPCEWKQEWVPFSNLTALPNCKKAITQWNNRDAAFEIVAKGIREKVDQIRAKKLEERQRKALALCRRKVKKFFRDCENVNSEQQKLLLNLLLQELGQLGLSSDDTNAVCREESASFQEKQKSLKTYEQDFWSKVQTQHPISEPMQKELKNLQRKLRLTSKDVSNIEDQITNDEDFNHLNSARGIDYRRLRDLLKAGSWQKADVETATVISEASGKELEECFSSYDLQQFPCSDLDKIDHLWVKYSQGQFGFSVQQQIWATCGKAYIRFSEQVGWQITKTVIHERGWLWRKQEEEELEVKPLKYNELTFSLDAPKGHLPYRSYLKGFHFHFWSWS